MSNYSELCHLLTLRLYKAALHIIQNDNLHRCIDDGGGTGQEFGETELPVVQRLMSSTFLDGKTKQKKALLLKNQKGE